MCCLGPQLAGHLHVGGHRRESARPRSDCTTCGHLGSSGHRGLLQRWGSGRTCRTSTRWAPSLTSTFSWNGTDVQPCCKLGAGVEDAGTSVCPTKLSLPVCTPPAHPGLLPKEAALHLIATTPAPAVAGNPVSMKIWIQRRQDDAVAVSSSSDEEDDKRVLQEYVAACFQGFGIYCTLPRRPLDGDGPSLRVYQRVSPQNQNVNVDAHRVPKKFGMRLTAQPCDIWMERGMGTDGACIVALAVEDPEHIDMFECCGCVEERRCTLRWQDMPSDVDGCVSLVRPEVLCLNHVKL